MENPTGAPSLDVVYKLVSAHFVDLEKDIQSLLPSFKENVTKAEELFNKLGVLQDTLSKEIETSKTKLDGLLKVVGIKRKLDGSESSSSPKRLKPDPKELWGKKKKAFKAVQKLSGGDKEITAHDVANVMGTCLNNITGIMKYLTDQGYFVRENGTSPADPYTYKIAESLR